MAQVRAPVQQTLGTEPILELANPHSSWALQAEDAW